MEFLTFQLAAPLAAFGPAAVGEYRGSEDVPSRSALLGLIAAALGIVREDEAALQSLQDGLSFGIGLQQPGQLLRDYHTAQVPPKTELKDRPHRTRRDELAVPKDGLSTILSTRDYRQQFAALIAVACTPGARTGLAEIADALRLPKFALYLGRKSCPLALPMYPQLVEADSLTAALHGYSDVLRARVGTVAGGARIPAACLRTEPPNIRRLYWDAALPAGVEPQLTLTRKDDIISRSKWQFADKKQYCAELSQADEHPADDGSDASAIDDGEGE